MSNEKEVKVTDETTQSTTHTQAPVDKTTQTTTTHTEAPADKKE